MVPLEQAGLEASAQPVVRAELAAAAMLGYEMLLGLSRMFPSAARVVGQAESGALVAQGEPQATAVWRTPSTLFRGMHTSQWEIYLLWILA